MDTSIPVQNCFVPSELYEMAARIARTHQITAQERSVLRQAFLANPLTEEENRLVNRLYRALRRGRIRLV